MYQAEENLLKELQGGSSEAFSAIWRMHGKGVFSMAYLLLKDVPDAEDVVQEVFYDIWQRRYQLQITTSLRNYLLSMARFKSINLIKRRLIQEKFLKAVPPEIEVAESVPFEKEAVTQYINEILKTVNPPQMGEAFRLSYFEEFSHKQISEELGITIASSRTYVWKAGQIIKNFLKKNF